MKFTLALAGAETRSMFAAIDFRSVEAIAGTFGSLVWAFDGYTLFIVHEHTTRSRKRAAMNLRVIGWGKPLGYDPDTAHLGYALHAVVEMAASFVTACWGSWERLAEHAPAYLLYPGGATFPDDYPRARYCRECRRVLELERARREGTALLQHAEVA